MFVTEVNYRIARIGIEEIGRDRLAIERHKRVDMEQMRQERFGLDGQDVGTWGNECDDCAVAFDPGIIRSEWLPYIDEIRCVEKDHEPEHFGSGATAPGGGCFGQPQTGQQQPSVMIGSARRST